MKRQLIILAVALLTAGALTTSCSSEDNIADEPQTQQPATNEMTFTATISPKSTATTRSVDASGHTAWVSGEEIAIYYETTNGHATTTATVGTPNGDGSAPITATLTDAKNGAEAKFVYPATLANATGDIDESKLLTGQKGILTYGGAGTDYSISKRFDAAKGTGTIIVSGSEASVSGTISLANQVCICKFSFSPTGGGGTIDNIDMLEIYIDGKTYSIVPSGYKSSKTVYVAMLPTSGADALFGVYKSGNMNPSTGVTLYGENYVKLASNVTLEAGKFYNNVHIEYMTAQEYSGEKGSTITIPANGAIILNNATVSVEYGGATNEDVGIKTAMSANGIIVLKGTNSVSTSVRGNPGIYVETGGTTLVIGGSGSLTATAGQPSNVEGERAAAIGCKAETAYSGSINIHGTIASLAADGGVKVKGASEKVIIDGVENPTSESTYPHLTRSGDTWTHK